MGPRIGKIASLTSMVAGAATVAFATMAQLCSRQGNELFYKLGIDSLTTDDYLIHRIGIAAVGVGLLYAGKKGFKYSSDQS